jgi:hypothetical protein
MSFIEKKITYNGQTIFCYRNSPKGARYYMTKPGISSNRWKNLAGIKRVIDRYNRIVLKR